MINVVINWIHLIVNTPRGSGEHLDFNIYIMPHFMERQTMFLRVVFKLALCIFIINRKIE